ncbi:MAG: 3-deoxy-7-phosphoheptulonate synthase [Halieaceae bacterium]|jgi:3-deoxy-7-phosphoheptulonate synthase|nr:3-deoxy-7-phosphoheptulonate synthase [Halieaceae bacterium]
MDPRTDDLRIAHSQPLISPAVLAEELPLGPGTAAFVQQARSTIEAILAGHDPRVLVIVGPCSVHDPAALLDFARRFKAGTDPLTDALFPVLRVYFEKPRTIVGWKGLINDPDLDGSCHVNKGLHLARQVLLDVAALGLPAATEFLDTTLGQYYAELVSFGAIGARTVESQVHRELASGLSMPVGFKNATSGAVGVAVDAIRSASHPHWFPSLTKEGMPAILQSTGNPHGYLILRGGSESGPNYGADAIAAARAVLRDNDLLESLIVDCSHGNSGKDPARQAMVMESLCQQIAGGETAVRGLMIESHLRGGTQPVVDGRAEVYGQSITDACLALDETLPLLEKLATTLRQRRNS